MCLCFMRSITACFFFSTLPPKCVCILNSVSFVAAAAVVINGGEAYQ